MSEMADLFYSIAEQYRDKATWVWFGTDEQLEEVAEMGEVK